MIHVHDCECGRKFDCAETKIGLCDVWCGFCNDKIRNLGDDTRISRGEIELERRSRSEAITEERGREAETE